MIDINIGDIPLRDDSPPCVMKRAADHMAATGVPWLRTLADRVRNFGVEAEDSGVTIDLTAAYEECSEPHATRALFHIARDYLASVEGGEASC